MRCRILIKSNGILARKTTYIDRIVYVSRDRNDLTVGKRDTIYKWGNENKTILRFNREMVIYNIILWS